jgi:NitT/TauT family transport system substrate-binding protein
MTIREKGVLDMLKKTLFTVFLVMLLAALMTGGGCQNTNQTGPKPLTKVRLSVAPFQDTLLPIIGKEKGWFEQEGLDVEVNLLPWYSVQESLASGSIDVGISNISSVIGAHHNFPENIYYYGFNTFDNGFAIMTRPNSGLKAVAQLEKESGNHQEAVKAAIRQLKGKTFITTSKTDMEQVVAYAVRSVGMDFHRDIKVVDMEPDEGLAAFLSGTGDAYVGGIPQRTRALKEGYIELVSGVDLGPSEINGLATTRKFAEGHEEEMLKLIKVMFRIIQHVNSNMDDGGQIIINELNKNTAAKFTMDDFKKFWNNFEHYTATPKDVEEKILNQQSPTYWKSRWDDTNYYFYDMVKSIPKPVDPTEAFWMERAHHAYVAKYGE